MKSLASVVLILLCSWTAFGHELAVGRVPLMAASLLAAAENQDTPAGSKPAPQKIKKSHKALWITVAVVAVAAVIVGTLVYQRFHNEGAI
jgi:hypothetical protein